MLSRRKLLSGLICAPFVQPAEAFWHGQVSGGGSSNLGSQFIGRNMTQVKPVGIPTIDWNHPLSQGLIVDLFDLGNGQYANLCAGNKPFLKQYGDDSSGDGGVAFGLANGSTNFGTATYWPGPLVQGSDARPGPAVCVQVNLGDLSIVNANDLSTKGIGAGNTIACAVLRVPGLLANSWSHIFGRMGNNAGEQAPAFTWAFQQPGGTNNIQAMCLHTSSMTLTQVGSNFSCPDNKYTTLLQTCQNSSASPGTGTASFVANGNLNGTTGSVSMFSINPQSISETDLSVGGDKHMGTSLIQNIWGGYIYWGRVWNRSLNPLEWRFNHNHPYAHYLT
jgi:hypothetical protein